MTDDHRNSPAGDAPDLLAEDLLADDLLLDALGRGAAAPADDRLAVLLAAWRTDLADGPAEDRADRTGYAAWAGSDAELVAAFCAGGPTRRPGRMRRLLIGVAGGVLVVAAALGIGANNAGPTSPLWPVARLVYPEQAAMRAAEHEIGLARRAGTDRRYAQAHAHLDRAQAYVTEVGDPVRARRLRDEIARLRAGLPPRERAEPGASGAPSGPAGSTPDDPVDPTAPVPPATPGQPAPTPAPGGGPEAQTPQPTRPGLLPSPLLPAPLLPSLPLLPDLPLVPSLLPTGLPL